MEEAEGGVQLPIVASITAAYLKKNRVFPSQVSEVIQAVHGALSRLSASHAPEVLGEPRKPFVSPRKSVWPAYIINLDDGSHHTIMTRYLKTKYNMTPAEYRRRWNLPPDYPMVAPNHREERSRWAKEFRSRRSTGLKVPAARDEAA